ncbi:MAG TPA: alpha/beta hydrolase [Pyrinomonadaceae bacterium]|nr:alpha/beta hydrolase [Pyrinomonadaceae bacterium]
MNIRHRLFLLSTAVLLAAATFTQTASAQPKNLQPESRFAKLDDARVHYVSYGKGDDALVLIHGWTQSIDAAWRDQIPEFAKHYRVIALDLPGHGQSDKPQFSKDPVPKDRPRKPFVYSMDHFARAVAAVMLHAKVKRAVLVGHSMGTPVARQFYRKFPQNTLGIIIVDGSLRPFGNPAMIDQLIANLRGPNYSASIDQMFGMMFGGGLSAEAQQRIKASTANTPQHVLVGAFEGMVDSGIWGEDKINLQVLAIMAKNPFYPPNVEESFRGIAPKMDFQLWDGVGHFLMMEKPREFNAAVIAWLDKNGLLKK